MPVTLRRTLCFIALACCLCCGACREQGEGRPSSAAASSAAPAGVALQKVELVSWYFGHEYVVSVTEPEKLARVAGILERRGFFGLDESYRNAGVRDGYTYTIRATKADGTIKSVTVQNVPQPAFVAIQQELFETGWPMPERWYQIE